MHIDEPDKHNLADRYSRKFVIRSIDGTLYLQFPLLACHNYLAHGIFTRIGGVSAPPFDSLNSSYNVGDSPEKVGKNLQVIKNTINAGHLIFMNQIHGNEILTLRNQPHVSIKKDANADALITDIPSVALMVKQADCQGVILYDPVKAVIAAVHCGWRGNVSNILGAAVHRMRSDFRSRESDILAGIGPSLGPCCAEFISYKEIFPEEFMEFMIRDNYFDLWELSRRQLLDAGLAEDRIEIAGVCTRCNTDLFYSYRGEGTTGRFATVAMLREKGL